MGTRSIIVIHGKARHGSGSSSFRLYKSMDGYPTGNLPIIAKALARAKDISTDCLTGKPVESLSPEVICGFIIGEATTESGMGAFLEYKGAGLDSETLGDFDPHWLYVIDATERTVKVYTGPVSKALGNDTTDPMQEAAAYSPEYREREIDLTKVAICAVELTGFKVNPKPAPSNVIQLAPKTAPKAPADKAKRKGSRLQPWQTK